MRTPAGWIEASFSRREGLDYFAADGTSLPEAFEMAARAVDHCRQRRRPTFLHLKVPRLLGHAGTDWEGDYLELATIEANEARDPLLRAAELAVSSGCLAPDEVLSLYEETRTRVAEAAARAGFASAGRRLRRGGEAARGRSAAASLVADQSRPA